MLWPWLLMPVTLVWYTCCCLVRLLPCLWPQVIEEHVLDMWPATEPGQEGAKLMLSYVVGECDRIDLRGGVIAVVIALRA